MSHRRREEALWGAVIGWVFRRAGVQRYVCVVMAGEGWCSCDACEDRAARPCAGASTTGQNGNVIGRWGMSRIPDIVSARPIDVKREMEGKRGRGPGRLRLRCGRIEESAQWLEGFPAQVDVYVCTVLLLYSEVNSIMQKGMS